MDGTADPAIALCESPLPLFSKKVAGRAATWYDSGGFGTQLFSGDAMSKAISATPLDEEMPPLRAKVKADDGSDTVYVRVGEVPTPDEGAHLKFDEFHPDLVELWTTNGEPHLQQIQQGLPDTAIMSVYPGPQSHRVDPFAAAATGFPGGWPASQMRYYTMQKETQPNEERH